MWFSYPERETDRAFFEIPRELDGNNCSSERMARAMVKYWQPGPIARSLEPAIASMLKLYAQHPVGTEFSGKVSDSVYVMF
jgi:hypothetical protein